MKWQNEILTTTRSLLSPPTTMLKTNNRANATKKSIKLRADKQQEDLDLPYLTGGQQQQEALALGGGDQLAASQQSLVSGANLSTTLLPTSGTTKVPSGHQDAISAQLTPSSTGHHQQNSQLPFAVAKSASSSSVLSSVSLASGAQMKPSPSDAAAAATAAAAAAASSATSDTPTPTRPSDGSGAVEAAESVAGSKAIADGTTTTAKATTNNSNIKKEEAQDEKSPALEATRDTQIQTPKPRIEELKQLLRHTNSLSQLPEFGVETEDHLQLGELMDQIDVWGLNIFEVHKYSQNHSLTTVMYKIFKVSQLSYIAANIKLFGIIFIKDD